MRSKINSGSRAVASIDYYTSRIGEKTNVAGDEFQADFWNGWVDASVTNVAQEKGIGGVRQIRMSVLKNISGTGLNQSGATPIMLTWQNAATGVAGYAFKLDGTPGSRADFVSAGGLISGDFQTITVPDGWYVCSDKAALTLAAGEKYYTQTEIKVTGGLAIPTMIRGIAAVGDANVGETGASPVRVTSNNLVGGALVAGTALHGPVSTWVRNSAGVKVVGMTGDSIAEYQLDSVAGSTTTSGDADGCTAFLNRALNAGGYSWVRTAVSSAQVRALYNFGGHAIRELMLRNCSSVITEMGGNDRGAAWTGAAGVGYLASYRWWWDRIRKACRGGNGKVVQTALFPATTSNDQWASVAGQTATGGGTTGPGSTQYDYIHPFLKAGGFNTAVGDPDVCYDLTVPLFAGAVAAGLTDVDPDKVKWPANGLGGQSAGTPDGVHPKGVIHTYVAADLTPKLPALLGF